MPWYKVYCNSGPGHQSHHEFFHWEDEILTREGRKDLFEESFRDRDWPVGDVKLLKFLPVDIKKMKLKAIKEYAISTALHSKKMLKIIKNTKAAGCAHLYTTPVRNLPPRAFPVSQCISCKKIRVYGDEKWKKMPKNLGAVVPTVKERK